MKTTARNAWRAATAALIVSIIAVGGRAEREIAAKYVTYSDNNEVNVRTTSLDLSVPVDPKTTLTVSGTLDGITAASRKIPVIDGVTGATPHTQGERLEQRKEYSVGLARKLGNHTATVLFDESREDDYFSRLFNGSWTFEFNNRNSALSLAYSHFDDRLFPFGVEWRDVKTSRILDAAFTSVLSPRSQVRLTASYALDDGFLSNPYHRVVINDYFYKERHPTLRDKLAFGLFYTLGFPAELLTTLQADYRYYFDNWDVRSHTLGLKLNRYLASWLMASARVRYYTQSGAYFFKERYAEEEHYMTGDAKLGPLSSVLYGAGLTVNVTTGLAFEMLYEQYNHVSSLDYSSFYNSVAKADLLSRVLYVGTRVKF